MRLIMSGLFVILLTVLGLEHASAQSSATKNTPRGYPYDSQVCAKGYRACVNQYLKVGWQSAAASTYCSQACRDFPPAGRR
jgi:hypothetical protein